MRGDLRESIRSLLSGNELIWADSRRDRLPAGPTKLKTTLSGSAVNGCGPKQKKKAGPNILLNADQILEATFQTQVQGVGGVGD